MHVESYFESVFGFREADYASTAQQLLSMAVFEQRDGCERCVFLPHSSHPASRAAGAREPSTLSSGWHYIPNVRQLRAEVHAAVDAFEARHPGYLALVRAHYRAHPRPRDLSPDTVFTTVTHSSATAGGGGGAALRVAHVLGTSSDLHLRYPGALFQAASQFNLLEFVSSSVTPEEGIAAYVYDATQGPDCAVACFAGTAYRNFLLHPDLVRGAGMVSGVGGSAEELPTQRGQRHDWQVNTLEDVTRFLTGSHGGRAGRAGLPALSCDAFYRIRNGYFCSTDGEQAGGLMARLRALADVYESSVDGVLDQMSDLLRVGVVRDATVTFGLLRGGGGAGGGSTTAAVVVPVLHTAWQTYNSALSLEGGGSHCADPGVSALARCVLNGTYEATLLASVLRTLTHLDEVATSSSGTAVPPQLPAIFLTKVGGGVFHNDPSWIAAAVERAMERVAAAGVPLDLRLVHFGRFDPQYMTNAHVLCGSSAA